MATYLASSPQGRYIFWNTIRKMIDSCIEDVPIYDHHYTAPAITRAWEQIQHELIRLRHQGL